MLDVKIKTCQKKAVYTYFSLLITTLRNVGESEYENEKKYEWLLVVGGREKKRKRKK